MPNPIYILFGLIEMQRDIDAIQDRIDLAREQMSHNDEFLEWMDREQLKNNIRQLEVTQAMRYYSSQN
jgi:hypothetical protein